MHSGCQHRLELFARWHALVKQFSRLWTPALNDTFNCAFNNNSAICNIALLMRLLWIYWLNYGTVYVCNYNQQTTLTLSSYECSRLVLAAAASTCVVRQSGTNFHRICEAQTLENSLSIAISTRYSSVRTAGGASDRCWLKARHTNGLTYLLTYLHMVMYFSWFLRLNHRPIDAVPPIHIVSNHEATDKVTT